MLHNKIIVTALSLCCVQFAVVGCASKLTQLEQVAKDWCMTIRASQVLPVYPLSEDFQPGDVFLVQTPLAKQVQIYKKRGFLPLDQLVTRLPRRNEHDTTSTLPYEEFYRSAYWKGTYANVAHERPGWTAGSNDPVKAPRAAFPTYNFSVQRGGGLKLAIPIQGVPVGLGIMGASRATGSVTIKDASTYGIDNETLARELYTWWRYSPEVQQTLAAIVKATGHPVYLRAVNRVYLTGGVSVSLTNLDAGSFGADVGASPALDLLDLAQEDPQKVEASAKAFKKALEAMGGSSTAIGQGPGGTFRFVQASQRSVTLEEDFDRPLVIGYLGFDVRVYEDRKLSPPIPSFAVLNRQVSHIGGEGAPIPWSSADDGGLSDQYLQWLRVPGNREQMIKWLKAHGVDMDPADLWFSEEHLALLYLADDHFKFGQLPDGEKTPNNN